jgi:hypothetical protein
VSVICQRSKLEMKSTVPVFGAQSYSFASTYEMTEAPLSEPMGVA